MRRSNLSGKHALSTPPRLELQSENGDPVFSVSEIADPGISNWETAKTSGPQISGLSAIFSAFPSLSVAGNVFTSNYAKVDIPLDKLAKSKKVLASLQAMTRNPDGTVAEHATLSKPDLLHGLVSVAVVWQIASIAVAQKHLHDINKSLSRISEKLDDIHTFLSEERKTKITGIFKEFIQMKREMADHGSSHISIDNVGMMCSELTRIEDHLCSDIDSKIIHLSAAGGLNAESQISLENLIRLLGELQLCFRAKLYGYQIIAVASEEHPAFLDDRLKIFRGHVDETLVTYRHLIYSEIKGLLGEETRGSASDEENLNWVVSLRRNRVIDDIVYGVDQEVSTTQNLLEQLDSPISILLKVDGDEVQGFSLVPG